MAKDKDQIFRPGIDKEQVRQTDDTGLIEAVRRRAHELWEQEGQPAGRELDHWTRAEQEILGQAPPLA